MRTTLLLLALLSLSACHSGPEHRPVAPRQETVVLIHGLAGAPWTLSSVEDMLEDEGYEVHCFQYSAHKQSLDEISRRWHQFLNTQVSTPRYHIVAFSLGNVVLRHAARKPYRKGLGRVVMIAPPNQPSELAQLVRKNLLFQIIAGDAGQKLASADFYRQLPAPPAEFGVIAGYKGQCLTFEGDNDGIISVAGTRLKGMADWALVKASHPGLRRHKESLLYVRNFIQKGQFRGAPALNKRDPDTQ